MTTSRRNIVELEELDENISEVPELVTILNETIVSLNFILRQLTMTNMDGDILNVTIPAGSTSQINHRLKTIPAHRVILRQEGGSTITDGKFTSNYIELINSGVTDANITIIILKE